MIFNVLQKHVVSYEVETYSNCLEKIKDLSTTCLTDKAGARGDNIERF